MEVRCQTCNRLWFLERIEQITRDIGEAHCRCGSELHRWSEAASFTAIQIFDEPTVIERELICYRPEIIIPAGTEIHVTALHEVHGPRLQTQVYRVIRLTGNNHLVKESDLMRSLGDPHPN